jgi:endogenous inhibitor of DNA gyrase (YacG/DUF329 family)
MKTLTVTCPGCKKKFEYYSSEFRPFCSERCRLIDLGQWLNESYTVPATKLTPDEVDQIEQIINEKNEDSGEDDSFN